MRWERTLGSIRVVTLNLKGLGSGWFEERERAIVEGLRRHDPDVVLLQEATVRYDPRIENDGRAYNQARAVGEAIGLGFCAFAPYGNPIEVMSPEQGGVATLSRHPIRSVRNRRLPPGHEHDARVALLCSVDTPFGELEVVNTHLSWRPDEMEHRVVQLGIVLEEFAAATWLEKQKPAVLGGDLNGEPDEPAIRLASQRLCDVWHTVHPDQPGHTWVRHNGLNRHPETGDRRLDYLFCAADVRVHRCELIFDRPDPIWATDHLGILADLEWK